MQGPRIVDAALRSAQDISVDVGRHDLDVVVIDLRPVLKKIHRDRIGLLSGRAGHRPDTDTVALATLGDHLGKDPVGQAIELMILAVEIGLVDRQQIDQDLNLTIGIVPPQALEVVLDAGGPGLLDPLDQALVDKIALVFSEGDAGTPIKILAELLILGRANRKRCSRALRQDRHHAPRASSPQMRSRAISMAKQRKGSLAKRTRIPASATSRSLVPTSVTTSTAAAQTLTCGSCSKTRNNRELASSLGHALVTSMARIRTSVSESLMSASSTAAA